MAAPGLLARSRAKTAARTSVPTLKTILANMDKSAAEFTSMMGDLEYTKVTVIVNDHSTQRGKIYFQKHRGDTRVMIAFKDPAKKYVLFTGGQVKIYLPKIAEVDEYQLAERQHLVEQFLLLGFGTKGAALQKAYRIALRGADNVLGDQAFLLELVPRSPKVLAQLRRIQLWISPRNWEPVQQKFFEPGGDYVIARYTGIKFNVKISDKDFRLPLKGKVRTVRPQGR